MPDDPCAGTPGLRCCVCGAELDASSQARMWPLVPGAPLEECRVVIPLCDVCIRDIEAESGPIETLIERLRSEWLRRGDGSAQ